jgi:hypothetical protein
MIAARHTSIEVDEANSSLAKRSIVINGRKTSASIDQLNVSPTELKTCEWIEYSSSNSATASCSLRK